MDPFIMAGATLAAVGSLLSGITGYAHGKAIQRQKEAAADQAKAEAGVQAQVELAKADKIEGDAAVSAAANGGGLSGSAQDVLAELRQRATFNAKSALWAGLTRAHNDIYEGKVARTQGTQALISGVVGAGSSLASGFGQSAEASKQATARQSLGGS